MATLYLEKEEELTQIIERIKLCPEEDIQLIIPEHAVISGNGLNLKILFLESQNLGKEVAVITPDAIGLNLAKRAGFLVAKKLGEKYEAGKERRYAKEKVRSTDDLGFVYGKDISADTHREEDKDEFSENVSSEEDVCKEPECIDEEEVQPPLPQKSKKSRSFLFVTLSFIGAAVLFLGGCLIVVYILLPKVTIELYTVKKDFESDLEITVDIQAKEVDRENGIIPGTIVSVAESGQKDYQATGKKMVGDKASGSVTIQNLTDDDKIFPVGTTLTVEAEQTGAGLTFVTTAQAVVPHQTFSVPAFGQRLYQAGIVEVPVSASAIGTESNLVANTNFSLSGENYSAFNAMNFAVFSGGSSREVTVISESDRSALLSQLSTSLYDRGKQDIQSKLIGDQQLIEKAIKNKMISQSFDKQTGEESDVLKLSLTTESVVTVYSDSQIKGIALESFSKVIPEGFDLKSENIAVVPELSKIEDNGNLTFLAHISASALPQIDTDAVFNQLHGIKPIQAEEYLKGLDNVAGYKIELWPPLPGFLQALPRVKSRFVVNVIEK